MMLSGKTRCPDDPLPEDDVNSSEESGDPGDDVNSFEVND